MIRYLLFLSLCAISVVNVDIDNLVLMMGVFCAIGFWMIAWDFYKLQKRIDSVKDENSLIKTRIEALEQGCSRKDKQ